MKKYLIIAVVLMMTGQQWLSAQFFEASNAQSAGQKIEWAQMNELGNFGQTIKVTIDKAFQKTDMQPAEWYGLVLSSLHSETNGSGEITISVLLREDRQFQFMGDQYAPLDDINDQIEAEEERMKRQGYFQFMDEWYPSLDHLDSKIEMKKQQAGYFKFLGEEYAPMPAELRS